MMMMKMMSFILIKSDAADDSSRRKPFFASSKFTEKNTVCKLHDYKYFFSKQGGKLLRKTSVSNIKRRRANSSIFCETEIESEKKETNSASTSIKNKQNITKLTR